MVQQGQVFELTRRGKGGERLWAYRGEHLSGYAVEGSPNQVVSASVSPR
jgi:hypothetical protein